MGKIKEISGQIFGSLTIIDFCKMIKGHSYWNCKCKCGKMMLVRGSHVRFGAIKSCGCSWIKDITGEVFHFLTAIKYIETRNTNAYWLCRCICGKEVEVAANNLRRKEIRSCGCKAKDLLKETSMEKYGVENPASSSIVKEKRAITNIKKWGCRCSLQNPEVSKKSKDTIKRKYNVTSIMHCPEIALKVAKSSNNSYILKHWFSNEEIVCQGSYEQKVIEYFNKNYIDYNWQCQVFLTPNGKTYRPDCYLPDQDMWIEIKGYFRDDAEEKWEWFHKEHPNSELWDKNKLKKLNIPTRKNRK